MSRLTFPLEWPNMNPTSPWTFWSRFDVRTSLTSFEESFEKLFGDPTVVLPGAGSPESVARLTNAISSHPLGFQLGRKSFGVITDQPNPFRNGILPGPDAD